MRAFHEENRDLNLFDDDLEGGNSDTPRSDGDSEQMEKLRKTRCGMRRRASLVELHESHAVQKLIGELARKGLKIEHFADSDQPIFELIEGEGDKAIMHSALLHSGDSCEGHGNWQKGNADPAV